MPFTLTRPLASIDLETTGTDPLKDRIVQIGIVVLNPDGTRLRQSKLVNPGRTIPPEATAIHHITDEMVRDAKTFADLGPRLHAWLQGKDLVGFNFMRFDILMLDEEFRRIGLKLNLEGVRIVDSYRIYAEKFRRDLAAAVREFCGREHVEAHDAGVDAEAALDVLLGEMERFDDLGAMDLDGLADFCSTNNERHYADLARKLWIDDQGDLRFAFGRHEDERVKDHWDFVEWMGKKDFPGSTMEVLREHWRQLSRRTPN